MYLFKIFLGVLLIPPAVHFINVFIEIYLETNLLPVFIPKPVYSVRHIPK